MSYLLNLLFETCYFISEISSFPCYKITKQFFIWPNLELKGRKGKEMILMHSREFFPTRIALSRKLKNKDGSIQLF